MIIPVWNGRTLITQCLTAVYNHSGRHLAEVICVDNASGDDSAALIAAQFPQVTLLRQPVNLGFAGGVNAGLLAASGSLLVLLNQDCLVRAGWLDALVTAVKTNPAIGIVGATIFDADGAVNHAGAVLERPLAYGRHLTDNNAPGSQPVEYVTGAVFGITRAVWENAGPFDEAFYPAYYEETDYCFRARRAGFDIVYVPQAQADHLFSSREWQTKPIQHNASQHEMRYRFIAKHYSPDDLTAFFTAESAAINGEVYFEQAIGRLIAARQTLRRLDAISASRERDLGEPVTPIRRRQLETGFTQLLRHAFAAAEKTSLLRDVEPPAESDKTWTAVNQRLQQLQQQEYGLLTRIYLRPPDVTEPETKWQRFQRLFIRRPFRFITGRDYYYQSQLNTVHVARLDQIQKMQRLIQRRLTLLENLAEYDHD